MLTAKQVNEVSLVHQALLEALVFQVCQDNKDQWDLLVPRDLREMWVLPVREDTMAKMENQDEMVALVQLVSLGSLEKRVKMVFQDQMGLLEVVVILALVVCLETQVLLADRVHWDPVAHRDPKDHVDRAESRV